ncbi:GNAT family N-acetyltransferase [Spirosoma radiotolerans]|nr:GNAT family N-acetyltransferase [Spirosoma radiotolerans]
MFTPFPILKTERLTLRQVGMNDEQEIVALRSDREVNKYLGRQPSNTIDEVRNFINQINENSLKNDSIYWAITVSNHPDLIGAIGLFGFSEKQGNCEIGYELLPAYQGQGIMQEAVRAVIDYAFATINVQAIEATLHPTNQRSIKLLEKFSFRASNQTGSTDSDILGYQLNKSN